MVDWHDVVRQQLRLPKMRREFEERMLAELADHLEQTYEEAIQAGATPAQAQAVAMEALGKSERAANELVSAEPAARRQRAVRWAHTAESTMRSHGGLGARVADVVREFRLTARALVRRPLFAGAVVLVLAIGIAGTSAIFTLVDSILLSPLPFAHQERLVSLHHEAPTRGFDDAGQCAAWHLTYEDDSQALDSIGMFEWSTSSLRIDGSPEAVPVLYATAGLFRALSLEPLAGRAMLAADVEPEADAVVFLTERAWAARFGGDAATLGQSLHIDGRPHVVAGIVPDSLSSLGNQVDLVLPLRIDQSSLYVGNIGFGSVARLQSGVSPDEAQAELQRLLPTAWERYPGGPIAKREDIQGFSVKVVPLKDRMVGSVAGVLWMLMAGVGLVLLVATANVANLLMVRASEKRDELALRSALGAGVLRIRWEAARETLTLGLLGGVLGLLFGHLGLQAMLTIAPEELPRLREVSLGLRVVGLTFALALAVSLVIALLPRFGPTQAALGRSSGRRTTGSRSRIAQTVVASGQVAVMLALLMGSSLMFRSLQELHRVDLGFDPASALAFRLDIPAEEVAEPEVYSRQFVDVALRLEAIPGVDAVAMASEIPMAYGGNVNGVYAPDRIDHPPNEPTIERHKWVGGNFFSALRIPVLYGRQITWDDVEQRRSVAVVSASFAEKFWGSSPAALGKQLAARPEPNRWSEVIGVVADVREDGVADNGRTMVYWPQVVPGFWSGTSQESILAWRSNGFAVRSDRVHEPGFLAEVRAAVWEVNPALPLRQVAPLEALVSRSVAPWLFVFRLLSIATGLALLLGAVGVYALISNGVVQRLRELGVRLALGATGRQVRGMVFRHGLIVCIGGLLSGLALGFALGRAMRSLLFGVDIADPGAILVASGTLMLVVFLATLGPARRAGSVDPMSIIRDD